MGRKRTNEVNGAGEREDDLIYVPLKVQKRTLRKIKLIAMHKDMGMAECIRWIVDTYATEDLRKAVDSLAGIIREE